MKLQTPSGATPAQRLSCCVIKPYLSTLVLWAGIALCLLSGLAFDPKVLTAVGLLTFVSTCTYCRREAGILMVFPLLLAGVLGFATFFPLQATAGIEFGTFHLTFDMILLGVAALHFLVNREIFLPSRSERSPRQKERELRQAVAIYKRQFARKDLQELEFIAEDRRFLPAAVLAARELISEQHTERFAL